MSTEEAIHHSQSPRPPRPWAPLHLPSTFKAWVLTGHGDVDILSPLTSQVGCMAGVDTGITLGNTGKHQLVALLVDSAVRGQPDSYVLPPHAGLRQTLGGQAGHTLLAASCEHPGFKWRHVFNFCRDVHGRETAPLLWVSGYLMLSHRKLWPFPAQTLPTIFTLLISSSYPSILVLPLSSELFSEWKQEPKSLHSNNFEGRPHLGTPARDPPAR